MVGIPPSGAQHVLKRGVQEAVLTEVGGGLRAYTLDGIPLIDGYGEDEICTVARGAPLLPWPNRLQDGRYEFMGRTYQTPLTEPARQNAIHGLTRWLSWDAHRLSEDEVVMRLFLHPQEGYPFTLSLSIDYRLSDQGLTVRTSATNAGDEALPYGAGHHPYLTVGTERIDIASLRIPALLRLDLDDRMIPTGRTIPVEGTPFDFLEPRPIGQTRLDTAYAGLVPDTDGVARVVMQAPAGGRRLILWMDAAYQYLMMFTGDTIPEVSRRRQGLGIEPMTCAPNAFRNRLGLITLEPGQSSSANWGILL